MTFDNVITNMLATETFDWVKHAYRAMDAKNLAAYSRFLDQDAVLKFANEENLIGKKSILSFMKAYWDATCTVNHNLINLYVYKNTIIIEADIEFIGEHGQVQSIPSVSITERNANGQISMAKQVLNNIPLLIK